MRREWVEEDLVVEGGDCAKERVKVWMKRERESVFRRGARVREREGIEGREVLDEREGSEFKKKCKQSEKRERGRGR